MKSIIVDANIGMTIFDIPEEVVGLISNEPVQNSDGALRINVNDVESEAVTDLLRREAMSMSNADIQVERIGTSIINIKERQEEEAEPQEEPMEIDEEDEGDGDDEDLGNEDDEDQEGPHEGTTREEGVQPREQRPQPGIVDISEEERPGRDLETLNRDQSLIMLGSALENEISNLARNLHDKQREFDRVWTKALSLKREIDDITAPIESNPVIGSLTRDVDNIRNSENLIESIDFIDGFIVATTSHLNTDNQIEGHIRKVGRMMIKINLKPILGRSSECPNPIIVRNLTRRYWDGSKHWECGHIKGNGVEVCWGTAWEMLFHAMCSRDIDSVLEVVIRFIKNPNVSDVYGNHMKRWPIVES